MAENGENENETELLNLTEELAEGEQDTFAEDAAEAEAEQETTETGEGDADTSAQGEVEDPVSDGTSK